MAGVRGKLISTHDDLGSEEEGRKGIGGERGSKKRGTSKVGIIGLTADGAAIRLLARVMMHVKCPFICVGRRQFSRQLYNHDKFMPRAVGDFLSRVCDPRRNGSQRRPP